MPVMNLPSMNPPAFGEVSNIGKLGKVRPDIISGGRFPSNSIWPSRQEICIVFTVEPFAPELTINCKLFSGNLHSKPAGRHTLQKMQNGNIKILRTTFVRPKYGFILVDSVRITVQCRFIGSIQHRSEFRIFVVRIFHFLGNDIERCVWRQLQCGRHRVISNLISKSMDQLKEESWVVTISYLSTLLDDFLTLLVGIGQHQNIVNAQREALALQKECEQFRK